MVETYSLSPDLGDPAVARGWAARLLLAEDARWAADMALSAVRGAVDSPFPVLLLGHHIVRIAHEGAIALRSADPHVGLPPLAALLEDRFASITARARHMTKLLDDTSKGHNDVVADFEKELQAHRHYLTGAIEGRSGGSVADLGIYKVDGLVVGATVPMGYRLSIHPRGRIGGEAIDEVTREWGLAMAVLAGASLEPLDLTPTLSFTGVDVIADDVVAEDYLSGRYDRGFREGVKLLLLMIEGDLNTVRLYLPHASEGYAGPGFRARVITIRHSLSSLREIARRHPSIETPELRHLRKVLDGPAAQRLLGREGGLVRHRCVHYEIRNPRIVPRFDAPMFGLLEAVLQSVDVETFAADVSSVVEDVAALLNGWIR